MFCVNPECRYGFAHIPYEKLNINNDLDGNTTYFCPECGSKIGYKTLYDKAVFQQRIMEGYLNE